MPHTRSRIFSALVVIPLLAIAGEGCRSAYAQGVSQTPTRARPRQEIDGGVLDAGTRDAGRRARDASNDVARDATADTGHDSGTSDVVSDTGNDTVRPPLHLPPQSPNRPIGGGPNEEPEEPIPYDDAGNGPLR